MSMITMGSETDLMSNYEMGLIGFFIASLIIMISAQISLERMSRQLKEGKVHQKKVVQDNDTDARDKM